MTKLSSLAAELEEGNLRVNNSFNSESTTDDCCSLMEDTLDPIIGASLLLGLELLEELAPGSLVGGVKLRGGAEGEGHSLSPTLREG